MRPVGLVRTERSWEVSKKKDKAEKTTELRTSLFAVRRGDREKMRSPPSLRLSQDGCGEAWIAVRACLQGVKGLDLQDPKSIVAPPSSLKLSPQAGRSFVKAIGVLVPAGLLMEAWALIRMCKPEERFDLLKSCLPEHVDSLTNPPHPAVRAAKDQVLSAAARAALCGKEKANLPQFFEILSLCSGDAKGAFHQQFPPLTGDTIRVLSGTTLIAALRMVLDIVLTLDKNSCSKDLHQLLSIAHDLEDEDPARAAAIKCLISPALTEDHVPADELDKLEAMAMLPPLTVKLFDDVPVALQSGVLRLAVEQAANSPDAEQGLDRLQELALLYPSLDAGLAIELEFSIIDQGLNGLRRLAALYSSVGAGLPVELESAIEQLASGVVRRLSNPAVLRQTLDLILAHRNTNECLDDLRALLWIAQDQDPARAVAMRCLIWPALTDSHIPADSLQELQDMAVLPPLTATLLSQVPIDLQAEVLRVAVEQAANSPDTEQAAKGLRQLASLYTEVDPELAVELKSAIAQGLDQLPAIDKDRWEIQQAMEKNSLRINPKSPVFDSAMAAGNLRKAAGLIRNSRDPGFRKDASRTLFEVICGKHGGDGGKLAEVGVDVLRRTNFAPAKHQTSTAKELAAVLLSTGEPLHTEVASDILLLVGLGPEQFIEMLLNERFGIVVTADNLRASMLQALPAFCDPERLHDLDFILRTTGGKALVKQAVGDYLLGGHWTDATVASLLQVLAPRIDLRDILQKDAAKVASRVRDMVMKVALTGDTPEVEVAKALLLQIRVWSRPEDDIGALLEAFGVHGESLDSRILNVLPMLAHADNAFVLDYVLMTNEGKQLIAEAFKHCPAESAGGATIASLFKAIAHRAARDARLAWSMAAVERSLLKVDQVAWVTALAHALLDLPDDLIDSPGAKGATMTLAMSGVARTALDKETLNSIISRVN